MKRSPRVRGLRSGENAPLAHAPRVRMQAKEPPPLPPQGPSSTHEDSTLRGMGVEESRGQVLPCSPDRETGGLLLGEQWSPPPEQASWPTAPTPRGPEKPPRVPGRQPQEGQLAGGETQACRRFKAPFVPILRRPAAPSAAGPPGDMCWAQLELLSPTPSLTPAWPAQVQATHERGLQRSHWGVTLPWPLPCLAPSEPQPS